jgi:hypothetical protein
MDQLQEDQLEELAEKIENMRLAKERDEIASPIQKNFCNHQFLRGKYKGKYCAASVIDTEFCREHTGYTRHKLFTCTSKNKFGVPCENITTSIKMKCTVHKKASKKSRSPLILVDDL